MLNQLLMGLKVLACASAVRLLHPRDRIGAKHKDWPDLHLNRGLAAKSVFSDGNEATMPFRINRPVKTPDFLGKKFLLLVGVVILSSVPSYNWPTKTENHFNGKTWWDYVTVLAGDSMEGRETGSPGLRKAEAYVVDQLKKAGLEPAGTDGYYQPVKFNSRQIVERDSSAALIRDGQAEPLTLGDEAYFNTHVDLAPEVEAPLVFVGYGLSVPEEHYDDLAGLDVVGKVAVVLTGSPAEIPAALASHYQSTGERWKAFRKAGVVGIIAIPNPSALDIPWARMTLSRTRPSMDLADPQFHETEGEQLALTFNPEKAEKLFAGSGHTFKEIADLAKDRRPLPRFPLAVSIKTKATVEKTEVESANVIARLEGSDPRLRNEYGVLSAHIDHLGIGESIKGERIYHGAMDNASGDAVLLDVAAQLKKSTQKLRRSLLFVFVTGEEEGLLGSKYFAANPTVDVKSMVADINVDMFLPLVPLKLLTVYGLAESDLGDLVRSIAESSGLAVQVDPEPLRNVFIRSDQYNFIRHGIPALAMDVAPKPGSPEQKIFKDWLTERYHAPSDDLNQPVDLSAAAAYEEVVRELMVSVANREQRPRWKAGSFFRRYANQGS
jgi:Zn-dependent M28 family amino/carboxypeptidase